MRKVYGQTKPPVDAAINWDSPSASGLIAAYLWNEGGGVPHDKCSNLPFSTSSGVILGEGGYTDGTGTRFRVDTPNTQMKSPGTTGAISVTLRLSIPDTSLTNRYVFIYYTGGQYAFLYGYVARTFETYGGWGRNTIKQLASGDNGVHTITVTYAASGMVTYFDGVVIGTPAFSSGITGATQITFGGSDATDYCKAIFHAAYLHNRVISPTEAMQLHLSPYDMFDVQPTQYLNSIASSGPVIPVFMARARQMVA